MREGHSSSVYLVAFSHDSTRLASASYDHTVKLWDAISGACLQTLEGHSSSVHSVAFSHDSTWLASASWDRTVKIWDASSGACLQTLRRDRVLYKLSFSSTSSFLYTEIGTIAIGSSEISSMMDIAEPERPQHPSIGTSSDNTWITYGGKNILWVPSEYRPSCLDICRSTVGIGVGTGRVWFCSINPKHIRKCM